MNQKPVLMKESNHFLGVEFSKDYKGLMDYTHTSSTREGPTSDSGFVGFVLSLFALAMAALAISPWLVVTVLGFAIGFFIL